MPPQGIARCPAGVVHLAPPEGRSASDDQRAGVGGRDKAVMIRLSPWTPKETIPNRYSGRRSKSLNTAQMACCRLLCNFGDPARRGL